MATNFFIADKRFMKENELQDAERFKSEALLCTQSSMWQGKGNRFSLKVKSILFFNIPWDVRLVNDNNSSISTVWELIKRANMEENKIVPIHETEKALEELMKGCDEEMEQGISLVSKSRAEEYARKAIKVLK